MGDCCELYLTLVRRSLLNMIYGHREVVYTDPTGVVRRAVFNVLQAQGLKIVRPKEFRPDTRLSGRDWPTDGMSMLSMARLENVQECVTSIIRDNVPGDLIEAGVWRGGASILMRAVLKAHGVTNRKVIVADSFEGLPPPDATKYPKDAAINYSTMDELKISLEEVRENFARFELLDGQVEFLKGWFKDTLSTCTATQLAVIRLDGDMYESTMDGLEALYPRLSPGGYVILDDYEMLEPSRAAVDDYRAMYKIAEPICTIDFAGAFWRKAL